MREFSEDLFGDVKTCEQKAPRETSKSFSVTVPAGPVRVTYRLRPFGPLSPAQFEFRGPISGSGYYSVFINPNNVPENIQEHAQTIATARYAQWLIEQAKEKRAAEKERRNAPKLILEKKAELETECARLAQLTARTCPEPYGGWNTNTQLVANHIIYYQAEIARLESILAEGSAA